MEKGGEKGSLDERHKEGRIQLREGWKGKYMKTLLGRDGTKVDDWRVEGKAGGWGRE